MKVVVKLFAALRSYGPDYQELELQDNAVLEDIIRKLNLPEKTPLLKIVNGKFADLNQQLRDKDEIALFPPIAGGAKPG